ncbi:MAG: pyridoxamine 5'-phosphate oxidase family protein [Pseudomonadota bacterium]
MAELKQTPQTTLKRIPDRASYDRSLAWSIIDQALIAHVGITLESGQPLVVPTALARRENQLLVHGSIASRTLNAMAEGTPVCITVTHSDGLVLARSVFESSMNYRSLVALGMAQPVTDPEDKRDALKRLTEHLIPGRWAEARLPTDRELGATHVLAMDLDEASVKVRQGPPEDLEKDLTWPVWAGVIPLAMRAGQPAADEICDRPTPDYVRDYQKRLDGQG